MIRTNALKNFKLSPASLLNAIEGYVFVDENGFILEQDRALDVIEKLMRIYGEKGINEKIDRMNEKRFSFLLDQIITNSFKRQP